MSPNTHAILSELHKLLSTYSAKDFQDAKNYSGLSRPMRAALDALCREAVPKNRSDEPQPQHFNYRPSVLRRSSAVASGLDNKDEILSTVRHSAHYDSIRSLLEFGRRVGIKVPSRPKDSKDRIARRLAAAISLLPEPKRAEALSELKSNTKSQTEGWIDVIRKTAP